MTCAMVRERRRQVVSDCIIRWPKTQYYCNQFHTIPPCPFHKTMDESATQPLLTLAFPGVHTNPSQHIGGRLADAPHCCARPPSPAQLLGSIAPVMAGKVGIGTGTGKVGMGTGDVGAGAGAAFSPAWTRSSGVQHLMWRAPPDRLLHSSPSLHNFKFWRLPRKVETREDTARVVVGIGVSNQFPIASIGALQIRINER